MKGANRSRLDLKKVLRYISSMYQDYRLAAATERIPHSCCEEPDACIEKIRQFGFAILAATDVDAVERIRRIAALLCLGKPHTPVLYRNLDIPGNAPFVDIKQDDNGHPGFNTYAGQPLHVDGLLDPIGSIRTSVLHCVRPATAGGDTLLFNAVGLWMDYLQDGGTMVLAGDDVLLRRSTLPGVEREVVGPAFLELPERGWVTRFSDGPTDHWQSPPGHEDDLRHALAYFREHAGRNGPRRTTLRLEAGETLVLRNDLLSHGRTPFRDGQGKRRHLIRALYLGAA